MVIEDSDAEILSLSRRFLSLGSNVTYQTPWLIRAWAGNDGHCTMTHGHCKVTNAHGTVQSWNVAHGDGSSVSKNQNMMTH